MTLELSGGIKKEVQICLEELLKIKKLHVAKAWTPYCQEKNTSRSLPNADLRIQLHRFV